MNDEKTAHMEKPPTNDAYAALIMEKMPAIVCGIAPDGTVLHLNKVGEEVTGYRSEELLGKNWFETLYPGDEYHQVERLFDVLQRGDVNNYEMVLTTRSGEKRTISWDSIFRYDSDGRIIEIIGFGIDLTARKQAEEALRKSQVHLDGILEATADGILAVDAAGTVIKANKRFASLWKIPEGIMATRDDRKMLEFVLDQLVDPDRFEAKVRGLFGSCDQEVDLVCFKDGRIFEWYSSPLVLDEAMVGRVWSFRDVTARKSAEEQLRKSEEMYRLVTAISPNAITVADPAGKIRMVNRKALELFGFDDDSAVIGHSLFEWVAPECVDQAVTAFGQLFVTGSVYNIEFPLVRRDGTRYWGITNASLVRDADGEPQLAIIVTADMTQRKQLEEERLKVQKLESVGILAGGIAHDFNNLLQGVFGYISMAKASAGRGEEALDLIEQAEQALKLSINLTTQLLTFAKGGQPVRKKVSLLPLIENAARFALSGARAAYTLTVQENLWQAVADEGQIGQVIQNIVMNANESMTEGGTVRIACANVVLPAGGHFLLPAGKYVRIDITDSGAGIAPQLLPKIFDPYFTTKQKGSGLGLATAFAIVRNHEGALEVTSEVNCGSTFTLHLPAHEMADEVEVQPEPAAAGTRGRILLLDDEEVVRLVVSRMARLLGHEIETAEDGHDAIARYAAAREAGEPFDVVILDLTVKGGEGGEQVLRRLLEIDPGVQAIVSSGYAENPVIADYASHGFAAYLTKPYTLEALRETLNSLLM